MWQNNFLYNYIIIFLLDLYIYIYKEYFQIKKKSLIAKNFNKKSINFIYLKAKIMVMLIKVKLKNVYKFYNINKYIFFLIFDLQKFFFNFDLLLIF